MSGKWSQSKAQAEETLSVFERLGIAVFPQKLRKKGSFVLGWPLLAVVEAIARCRRELSRPVNLAGRTGGGVAVIDADGKNGVDPEILLGRPLRDAFDAVICVVKTSRGYQVWLRVIESVGNGFCTAVGGDVFSEAHLAMLPPSIHPEGVAYEWVITPREPLAKADLKALGLVPDVPTFTAGGNTSRRAPAPPHIQREFIELIALFGIGHDLRGLALCPWHSETAPSLSINWEAALFHCFGVSCKAKGGLKALRRLAGRNTPTYSQIRSASGSGRQEVANKWGCDPEVELKRITRSLRLIGQGKAASAIAACKQKFLVADCECPEAMGIPISCGHPLCPRCFESRFAADLRSRSAMLPASLHLLKLRPKSMFGIRTGILKQARSRFREWRKTAGIKGGLYGVKLDASHKPIVLLAIPSNESLPKPSRAFDVEVVSENQAQTATVAFFEAEFWQEATSWKTEDELQFLLEEVRGRRRYQGFGSFYNATADEATAELVPLATLSGGSNSRAREHKITCPTCRAPVRLREVAVTAADVELVDGRYRLRSPPEGEAA